MTADQVILSRRHLPVAALLTDEELTDDLPTCLDRLADVLEAEGEAFASASDADGFMPDALIPHDPAEVGASNAGASDKLRAAAVAHAAARFAQGYSQGDLVVEYALLRGILRRHAGDDAGVAAELTDAACDALARASCDAMAGLRVRRARLEAEATACFLASLAHDLRGGLNAAMLTMHLVATRLESPDALDPAGAASLAADARDCRRLLDSTLRTTTRVLESEQLRAAATGTDAGGEAVALPGVGAARPRRVEVCGLVRGIARSVGRIHAADAKAGPDDPARIDVRARCPDNLWVTADPDLLTTVLLNLLTNAARYAGDAGPISVEVMQGDSDAGGCVVRVIDHGPGIAADEVAHLFDRYRRGNRHAGDVTFKGVGLGLFIARRASDLLGARLDVTATPGGGATFSLVLPPSPVQAPDDAIAD